MLEYAVQMTAPAQPELESQVRLWIKTNKKEDSRLEFKRRIDISTAIAKAEFIRDVIALANSEGESPRKEGHLVVGVKNGQYHDIQNENYDGATFGQIIDSYVFPSIDVVYEEFDNKSRGRFGVLTVKPDANVLYIANKKFQDDKGYPLLLPGQCWGRKSDRKIALDGEDIHARLRDIFGRGIEDATAPLQARIEKLEREGGPAFEVTRIRFDMEANTGWDALEGYLQKLLPYAREFDHVVKNEVLNAVSDVTGRTRLGMPVNVAQAVDSVLIQILPMGNGGLFHPSRKEISRNDQELLRRIEHLTFELTWDACRYLRDLKLVGVGAHLYWILIRVATLNGLKHLQSECLSNARYCQHICKEERSGKAFPEAHQKLEEEIADALDVSDCDGPTKS